MMLVGVGIITCPKTLMSYKTNEVRNQIGILNTGQSRTNEVLDLCVRWTRNRPSEMHHDTKNSVTFVDTVTATSAHTRAQTLVG